MIQHQEFIFTVMSPNDVALCQHFGCKRYGDWAVRAVQTVNNQDKIMLQFDNVCELHLFQTFLDAACGDF